MHIRFVTHIRLSRDLSHADCYMPISYNLSLTSELSRLSSVTSQLVTSQHTPAVPLPQSPRRVGHAHAQDTPPIGAAACLHSPSGRQQIALSDGFLDAKNPDPTTRVPNMPLKRRDAKLFTLC